MHSIPRELRRWLATQVPSGRSRIHRTDHTAMGHCERGCSEVHKPASHSREHFARALAALGSKVPAASFVLLHCQAKVGAEVCEALPFPCTPAHLRKARLAFCVR